MQEIWIFDNLWKLVSWNTKLSKQEYLLLWIEVSYINSLTSFHLPLILDLVMGWTDAHLLADAPFPWLVQHSIRGNQGNVPGWPEAPQPAPCLPLRRPWFVQGNVQIARVCNFDRYFPKLPLTVWEKREGRKKRKCISYKLGYHRQHNVLQCLLAWDIQGVVVKGLRCHFPIFFKLETGFRLNWSLFYPLVVLTVYWY